LLGLSAAHVRAGTLAAIIVDYEDVGRQTGEMAGRVLRGTAPDDVPVAAPRRVSVTLNLRTAEHLGLTLDPALVENASEVVR
jgi:putative ABC transport system substrate-binding protein